MKTHKIYQALVAAFFASITILTGCRKNDSTAPENRLESNLVFFVDTFRVYSSDLEGEGLKALVDEDEKSGNNYINAITFSNNKKFVYGYKTAGGAMQIKVANADGSNKKVLKSLPSTASISFLGGFGDKILYSIVDYSSSKPVTTIRTMSEDGSNDNSIILPRPSIAASGGSTFISTAEDYSGTKPSFSSYVLKFKNGTWDEASSFNIAKVNGLLRASAISDDGNTLVYVISADYSTLVYDVFVLDISKRDNIAKKVLSHTFPTTGEGAVQFPPQLSIALANGNTNISVGYGVDVDKQRYATKNDYYYVQNIDIEKGTIAKKWKITGEYGGGLLAN
ncbi:hypothetical protein [Pedobacter xixiisoli]|uniref:Lipoprotein n=1 Tax=Pedobacter xixiisoli TaxID=1476464 RepID=A0A285ZRY3_9SPHI|nr:hypothetical protein [Pedobacter xixiisoli]SOD12409.1 hypothetical protein SAMN06297358_0652 [Pedobacter xixiisoli]